jgi:hypothetical protein
VPTFNSNEGDPDTVPAVVTDEPFWGIVTSRFALIPGVTDCGSSGFVVFCWIFRTTFPFASLEPVAVGKPVVAVAELITFPFASTCLVVPAELVWLMIGLPGLTEASVSILTVIVVREEAFAAELKPRLSPANLRPAGSVRDCA